MKRKSILAMSLAIMLALSACGANEQADTTAPASDVAATDAEAGSVTETLTGQGEGFGGPINVTVTVVDGQITDVQAEGQFETRGLADPAFEEIPGRIVAANSTDVDIVSGVTVTSEAIMYAVNNALDSNAFPYPLAASASAGPESVVAASVYQGFGTTNLGRVGPGTDNEGVQVYSINQVLAHALFDDAGRILALKVDQIEYSTPNYDGEGMPHFSGFPGQGGYNADFDHDGVVDGLTEDTEENYLEEVSGWVTKRERGTSYRMGAGTWAEQMDAFQNVFIGMTVAEVSEWFDRFTSDINGRPLKPGSSNEQDAAKFDALTEEEQNMLIDVTTSATMSLNDNHGDIIAAIVLAYENRVPLDISGATGMGIGVDSSGRIGPGRDSEDVQVYSLNQVFANTLFDNDGRIVAILVDQLEYSTPNYDGAGMPHFTGFPGQLGLNNDENHDGTIDGILEPTEELFMSDIESWITKRDRGDSYRMGAGSWAAQMDAFQRVFVGMTIAEVEEWFDKYTSDINGRPLQPGSSNEQDAAKFDALTEEEQNMLIDVTTSATMSLNDSHGDIIRAIRRSFENRLTIDLTVQ